MQNFIEKSKSIHGNKYDYSHVQYTNNRTHVTIICPIHGEFSQNPTNHYRYGCKQCALAERDNKLRKTTSEFTKEAKEIHQNKYSYSKVQYRQAHKKVKITCPLHGDFLQTPRSHLNGRGCPSCKQGESHPRFGKPSPSTGYFGKYDGKTFRSLSELFWMISCDTHKIEYLPLDEPNERDKWQIRWINAGKPTTYCPDFLIIESNTIIDIKPRWRVKKEIEKLTLAEFEYKERGYLFQTIDCDTIPKDYTMLQKLWKSGDVFLYPKSEARLKKRLGI